MLVFKVMITLQCLFSWDSTYLHLYLIMCVQLHHVVRCCARIARVGSAYVKVIHGLEGTV